MRIEKIGCRPIPTDIPKILDTAMRILQYDDELTPSRLDRKAIIKSVSEDARDSRMMEFLRGIKIYIEYPTTRVSQIQQSDIERILSKSDDGYYKGETTLYELIHFDNDIIPAILHNKESKIGFSWRLVEKTFAFLLTIPYYEYLRASETITKLGCTYIGTDTFIASTTVSLDKYHNNTRVVIPNNMLDCIPWSDGSSSKLKVDFVNDKWTVEQKGGNLEMNFLEMGRVGAKLDDLLHIHRMLEGAFKKHGEMCIPPLFGINILLIGNVDQLASLISQPGLFQNRAIGGPIWEALYSYRISKSLRL